MSRVSRRVFLGIGTAAAAAVTGGLWWATTRYETFITRWWSGTFTQPETAEGAKTVDAVHTASANLSIDIMGEGAVLLKNNGILPLDKGASVAFLGFRSYKPVYIGAGSVSQGEGSTGEVNFFDAFEEMGYKVDSVMKGYYGDEGDAETTGTNMFMMAGGDYKIYDEAIDTYSSYIDEAAKNADTAIVVFGRAGGEGGDLPIDMESYENGDAGTPYLRLQTNETDLLDYAIKKFDHVIVLLDSANAMELGPIKDNDKVEAAIWVGAPGGWGTKGVAKVMNGDYNPSGHMVDTLPYDVTQDPTYKTCTCGTYQNYEDFDDTDNGYNNKVDGGMVWYAEGIYVGYRYYETAAAEGTIDYDKTVCYPFGFGLSYTTFDWAIKESRLGGVHEMIEVDVEVTNTGDVAGKDVVQLYAECPYTPGGIEKAARVLEAFQKTSLLEPGASEVVTLSFPADELASYDYQNERCYVADAGEYKLHIQTDAHSDKEGCEPIVYTVESTRVYKDEGGVGARSTDFKVAENQFDPASMGDGNVGAKIPWMTREDFAGTNPVKTIKTHIKLDDTIKMGDEAIQYMLSTNGGSDVDFNDDSQYVCESMIPVETDADNGLTCDDFAGYTEWEDENWDKLINQMSLDELQLLTNDCGYGTPEIPSIGKKLCADSDGPAGVTSMQVNYYGHEHCGAPVTAATWNPELAYAMGEAVGQEAKVGAINGWYAPGLDTHRTPFGGRCAEYYSEDPVLAGKVCAAEIRGAQSTGLYCYVKHFALNDQDQNRGGMYTWAHEQAIREIYLRAFEYAFKEGKAMATMYAYNRIGPMECSVCKGLTRGVLFGEWGSHAQGLTDGYSAMIGCDKYEHPDLQIRAGGGMLLYTGGYSGEGGLTERTYGSTKGIEMMHDMAKRMIYVYCNSNAMEITRDYTPYWKWLRAGITGVIGAGTVAAWAVEIGKTAKENKAAKNALNGPKCPNCGGPIDDKHRFCRRCGFELNTIKCSECGAVIDANDGFCKKCGTKVAAEATTEA